jgi:quercetin dioxygenase-like cupin family protein
VTFAAAHLVAVPLAAQGAAPAAVPVAQEPHHRLVLDNGRVRVIDATLPPGYTSLYHVHDRDNVPIAVGAGRARTEPLGGAATEADVPLGRVTFAAGGYTHRVGNAGATTLHFIDVELLGQGAATDAGTAPAMPRHELVLDNARVRAWRVVLGPGDSLASHTHGHPLLLVTVRGATLRHAQVRDGLTREPAGAWRWYASGELGAVANVGAGEWEVVEVEPRE